MISSLKSTKGFYVDICKGQILYFSTEQKYLNWNPI